MSSKDEKPRGRTETETEGETERGKATAVRPRARDGTLARIDRTRVEEEEPKKRDSRERIENRVSQ